MAARVPRFSSDFVGSAREEADRLRTRIAELRMRGDRWSAVAERAFSEAGQLEVKVRELDELLGRTPQLRMGLQQQTLQGRDLRNEAIRVLLEHRGLRIPIHYRAWYDLLTAAGVRAGGKNPRATFLTQISRSPLVERVTQERGVYQINPESTYERGRLGLRQATEAVAAATDQLEALKVRRADEKVISEAARNVLERRRERDQAERRLAELLEAKRELLDLRLAVLSTLDPHGEPVAVRALA